MKITFTIYSLYEAGGAERNITIMANYWAEKGWSVTVVTFDDGRKPPFYQLNTLVKHINFNFKSKKKGIYYKLKNYLQKDFKIRKLLIEESPDVLISFASRTSIKILRAMLFSGIPIIVSLRNTHSFLTHNLMIRCCRNWLYPEASCIVCQTRKMMHFLPRRTRRKSVVIPNPVQKDNHLSPDKLTLPAGKLLFAVGGMGKNRTYLKGFDLLIPIFVILANKNPDWSLVIIGDGPERKMLKQKIDTAGLQDRVYLPGSVDNIYSMLKKGDLFVLSSRYEGFPNALCEAMACGLPAVSFDCPSGPSDIIRHGVDGLLVPPEDQEGMIKALDELMINESLRKAMGQKASEVAERFSVEKIMGMWESVINAVRTP